MANELDSLRMAGFDPWALYALNSTNTNRYIGQQYSLPAAQQTQVPDTAKVVQTADTVSVPSTYVPSFKGSASIGSKNDNIGAGTVLGGLGTIALGALGTIYTYRKGKAAGAEGFKECMKKGWKALWSNKKATETAASESTSVVRNLIQSGGNKLECQVQNGKDLVKIKNGIVESVIVKTEKEVKNISALTVPSTATAKNSKLTSIERIIKHNGKDYKVILDTEGKAVETLVKDKTGKFVKADSIKNKDDLIKKAETFKQDWTGRDIQLYDGSRWGTYNKDVNVTVRNGELVEVSYRTRGGVKYLNEEEIAKFAETYKDKIGKIGKESGCGVQKSELIYEYADANRRYIFDGNKKLTKAFDIQSKELKSPQKVSEYLENNNMKDIATTGKLPDGAKITSATYTSDAGNIYYIQDGKIKSVKIKEACEITTGRGTRAKTHKYTAGETISGNKLDLWHDNLAANKPDWDAVKAML